MVFIASFYIVNLRYVSVLLSAYYVYMVYMVPGYTEKRNGGMRKGRDIYP